MIRSEADDGVERGAQLVRDVGEEFALDLVGLVERDVGLRELAELQVEALVDGAELVLVGAERLEHVVEDVGELLELIAGVDVGADVEVPVGDLLRGLAQDVDGREDQPRGDEPEDADRQQAGDEAREDGVHPVVEELGGDAVGVELDVEDLLGRAGEARGIETGAVGGGGGADAGEVALAQGPGVAEERPPLRVLERAGEFVGLHVRLEALDGAGEELVVGRGGVEVLLVDEEQRVGVAVEARGDVGRPAEGDAAGDLVLQPGLGQFRGGVFLPLAHQELHAVPNHRQRRRDDEDHRRAEQHLAFVRQADAELLGLGHADMIVEVLWNEGKPRHRSAWVLEMSASRDQRLTRDRPTAQAARCAGGQPR
ncbi:MAG: hypothetical protein NTW19_12995 [Planctomycetota bacterium]|nr:hypothetical protein [Planctomycetota bacterium]